MSISQCQILIIELRQDTPYAFELRCVERLHHQSRQCVDKREELHRAAPVIPPQEPSVTFRNHKCGCGNRGRRRKQTPEYIVIAVGTIKERDER